MLRIAVTGGIGSGKTAVTDYLESKGYPVIDADKISRAMTASGGKAIPEIRRLFGDEFIKKDGSMDRDKMRSLVYNDEVAMKKLEECTTKVVIRDIDELLGKLEAENEPVVFIAAPLLFEQGGSSDDYDAVWLVVADEEIKINRIFLRDSLDKDSVSAIMERQLSDGEKSKLSTDILENNDSLESLYERVDNLLLRYLKKIK